ncbi:MAG: hypothetical protein U1F33_12355 [Alphaproteobacteria bacterium]
MDENKSFGAKVYDALHRRELAAARWFWHEIKGREDAERALGIGQQAAFFAIILRIVFVMFQPSHEDMPELDYGLLIKPWMVGMLAFYGYIYLHGYRRWWMMLIAMAVFAADIIVLPRETGGATLAQALMAIYVLRCFFVGVRGARWIAVEDARRADGPPSR